MHKLQYKVQIVNYTQEQLGNNIHYLFIQSILSKWVNIWNFSQFINYWIDELSFLF